MHQWPRRQLRSYARLETPPDLISQRPQRIPLCAQNPQTHIPRTLPPSTDSDITPIGAMQTLPIRRTSRTRPLFSLMLPCFLTATPVRTRPRRAYASHHVCPAPTRQAAFARAASSSPKKRSNAGIDAVVQSDRFRDCFSTLPITELQSLSKSAASTPLELVALSEWDTYRSVQDDDIRTWLSTYTDPPAFRAIPVPHFTTGNATIAKLVVPIEPRGPSIWRAAAVYAAVPRGHSYTVTRTAGLTDADLELGWALAAYNFTRYKTKAKDANPVPATLVRTTQADSEHRYDVDRVLSATYMVRDMISTPAEDFGPPTIEAAALALSAKHGASTSCIIGQQLIQHGYPQVHCVGRAAAADRAPRLIDLVWNDTGEKTLTLVGKGVSYDTGGLSIKPTNSMVTMKKDMGGAAHVLGLAHMVMDARLNVRLRVLIPAVENSIDGNSYRPGDVLTARNGMTTLNMNSDAEGRLILADALVAATEDDPDLIIDCATLTGAQRVALGPEVPSIFCDDDSIANRVCKISEEIDDLVWRLPLHQPYRKMLDTPLADIKSCGSGGLGGAITAALYLKEFVGDSKWIHVDLMGYNTTSSPGRPEGGEAMGMRALFEYVRERYSNT